jgi:hypothetical protein
MGLEVCARELSGSRKKPSKRGKQRRQLMWCLIRRKALGVGQSFRAASKILKFYLFALFHG